MTEPEEVDEDLFADLYEADEITVPQSKPVEQAPTIVSGNDPSATVVATPQPASPPEPVQSVPQQNLMQDYEAQEAEEDPDSHITTEHGYTGTVGIKEDGKMFIGGLNWETTDESLRSYFTQFGEVIECTVMRDGATGRSRGFGFLTFKDPKTVNTVMVKEHFLDGKIIDPKRAIPRDEQEKTSKIFVGGVSQEATERDFENFFGQFGRVIDATLMMDKDTGRPRGFGFVTFEGEAAVEKTLAQPLEILGKPIEVKRAQPRGNLRDDEEANRPGKFGRGAGRGGAGGGGFGRQDQVSEQQMPAQQGNNMGMSPQMMAQYWQRMQQYFAMQQQMMAANQGAMNPMMQQMMMQQMMQAQGQDGNGSQSPGPGAQGMNGMNPAMMQQMQQMQQQQGGAQGYGQNRMMSPLNPGIAANRPGYTAQEQMAFEQRKYEQQAARRGGSQGGSTWDGMYDDVPQPNVGLQGGRGRGGRGGHTPQPSQAPANAPTGPKNAGRPGANYRGGGRGAHRGFHPYSRH